MKRSTPEHPKLLDLCARMKLRRWEAVGILESLWHFTARFAPQGDIGRYTNAGIARAIDYHGNANVLIETLVASHWVDTCRCHRLTIHDWADHADQTVERVLRNRKLAFVQHETSMKLSTPPPLDSTKLASLMPDAVSRYPDAVSQKPEPEPFDTIPEVLPPISVNGFDEFWRRYPQKVKQDQAARMWVSVVTTENVSEVFACLEAYQKSDLWARGTYENPDNWLASRARNKWQCRPAPPRQPKARPSIVDQIKVQE